MRLIRLGERSAKVADVQWRLRALGIEVDDEPGDFGDATQRAVQLFQQRRGIIVDGIVGPNTWAELVEASWRLGDRVLYLRYPLMRGDDVAALQARLNALGFDAGREDGIFGDNTARAVRAFQKEYGVREDGIFGANSFAALEGLRVDRPGTTAALREQLRHADSAGIHNALIMIDPGHGGDDRGERGPGGRFESDICWELARLLAEKLIGRHARVRFTRTETEDPDATERARRANEIEADLFISLHLNAHGGPTAEGAGTYYFGTSKAGESLAEKIQEQLADLGLRDCRAHARSFTILKETRMPAVLVEPAFITNPDEEKKLEETGFRVQIADAIATAVALFYNESF